MGLPSAFSLKFFGVESPGFGWGFSAFMGVFLRGVLGKVFAGGWFFCGELAEESEAIVVCGMSFLGC